MLRPRVGGDRLVTAPGPTLGEVIRVLDARHPGFAAQLLDSEGQLRPFVNVYVNDEDVRYLQRLDTPLTDEDVVSILPAVAGGHG